MDIFALSRKESAEFIPKKLTYAIRIRDVNDNQELPPLICSPLFKHVEIYRFDDHVPDSYGRGPLEEGLPEKIISDFQRFSRDCECLITHCNEGEYRSTAVALALNDIFGLGYNHFDLCGLFPNINIYVFKQLIFSADRAKLLDDKLKRGCLEPLFLAS